MEDAKHQTATRQVGDPQLQLHPELNSSRTHLQQHGHLKRERDRLAVKRLPHTAFNKGEIRRE